MAKALDLAAKIKSGGVVKGALYCRFICKGERPLGRSSKIINRKIPPCIILHPNNFSPHDILEGMRAFTLNTFISHIAVNQSTLFIKCIKYDIYNLVICTRLAQGIGQPSVCRIYFGVDRYRARNCRGGYRTILKLL